MADRSYTVAVNVVGDPTSGQRAVRKVGDEAETSSSRIRKAFGGALSTIGPAFNGALSPVMDAFTNIDSALDQMSGKAAGAAQKIGHVMTGVGAAGIGIGGILTAAGSKDQQAKAQLSQSISDVGASYDDFAPRIDAVNKRMAGFGYTADESMNAMQQLTQATKDPSKAIDLMGEAANLAAAKHESLTTAANQLTQVIAGKGTRVLMSLGIAHISASTGAKALTTATKDQQLAQENLQTAQKRLTDLEEIDHGKKTLTISDHIALQNAMDNVKAAQDRLVTANQNLKSAQDGAKSSGDSVQTMLGEVAKVTNGQASAAADSYAGHMRALRAEIENHVAEYGQKYGPALTAAGAGVTLLGSIISGTSSIFSRMRSDSSRTADQVKTDAQGMQKGVDSSTKTMAAEAEANTTGMETAVSAETAGMAATVDTEVGGMTAGVDTEMGAMRDTAIADTAAMAAGVEAEAGGLAGGMGLAGVGAAALAAPAALAAGMAFLAGAGIYAGATQQGKVVSYGGLSSGPGAATLPAPNPYNYSSTAAYANLGSIGSLANLANIPQRAGGGPVSAGYAYVVGEKEAELFVPSSSGAIVPFANQSATSGAGGGGGAVQASIVLDGRVLAQALIPYMRTTGLQNQKKNATRFGFQ